MIPQNQVNPPQIVNNHISVQAAAVYSGDSRQYLRRLLRSGKLDAIKIGQIWLVDKGTLDVYIRRAQLSPDNRYGPR
jgi:excisionase family DNA binding protein